MTAERLPTTDRLSGRGSRIGYAPLGTCRRERAAMAAFTIEPASRSWAQ